MGKVIIEKLLRSIPDIGDIYFLVRTKKNKTSDERKQDILSSPVSLANKQNNQFKSRQVVRCEYMVSLVSQRRVTPLMLLEYVITVIY